MNPLYGVDYSAGYPGGAALRAAGVQFVCRYLGTDSRCITVPEKNDLTAHGVAIVLIKETDGLGFRNGEAPGRLDAIAAQNDIARTVFPLNAPVYFTVDDQFSPGDGPGMTAYLHAAEAVLGSHKRVALYGPLAAINYAKQNGLATYYWQTSGWSGIPTVWSPANNLEQYAYAGAEHPELTINGVACDANRALTADYGQIGGSSMPTPTPTPPAVVYPEGMDAGIAKEMFGSFKAKNGVTVQYSEGDELARLWLASGSYGRIVDVFFAVDSPSITRLYWQFSSGEIYWRPNDSAPIRLMKP